MSTDIAIGNLMASVRESTVGESGTSLDRERQLFVEALVEYGRLTGWVPVPPEPIQEASVVPPADESKATDLTGKKVPGSSDAPAPGTPPTTVAALSVPQETSGKTTPGPGDDAVKTTEEMDENLLAALRSYGYLASVPKKRPPTEVPPAVGDAGQAPGAGEQPPVTPPDQPAGPVGEQGPTPTDAGQPSGEPQGEATGTPVAQGPGGTTTTTDEGDGTMIDEIDNPPDEELYPPPTEEPPPPEVPPPPDERLRRLKPCCRLMGVDLFYPITSDPLLPPKMQEAFNEPAIRAYQVFLHDRSFFESETDLYVKSVGYPFAFTRHYRSNVTTNKGGMLAHKWDFNYNKRIVPLASRRTTNGLFVEQLGLEQVPILYFNGQGRADKYDVDVPESDTTPRIVRNFGKVFKAYVTTYTSPPGAFHEIQRYVLTDDQPVIGDPFNGHPFGVHPNVEKFPDPNRPGVLITERIFYVLRDPYGFRHIFNCRGQVIYASDRNENLMTFIYNTDRPLNPLTQNPVLKTIIDTNNRAYTLEYEDVGMDLLFTNVLCELKQGAALIPRLQSITDFDGRKVVFQRQGGPDDLVLESVTWEPFGPQDRERGITFETRYGYTGPYLLQTIKAPREVVTVGPPYLEITWNSPRVARLKLGGTLNGREAGGEFVLTPIASGVLVEDRVGNKRRYQLKPVSKSMVVGQITLTGAHGDNRGPWTTKFKNHNEDYQVGEVELPKGNHIAFGYDKGNERVIQGAVRNKDPDYTYKKNLTKGRLESVTRVSARPDESDLVTKYEYDPLFNQVTKVTDPKKIVTTYQYSDAFPNSFFDKVSGDNGNPLFVHLPTVRRPVGEPLEKLKIENTYYPTNGLLRTSKDTGGHTTTYEYDTGQKEGYLKTVQFAASSSLGFENDSRGNVIRATDMGGTVTKFDGNKRDLLDRKIEDETGLANTTDYFYDRNGNLIRVVVDRKDNFDNPGGERPGPESRLWGRVTRKMEYDLLNRLSEVVEDAEGKDAAKLTSEFFYDGNGNLTVLKTPSLKGEGQVSTAYDYEGRDLVERINRGGGESIVRRAYDDNGNLEAVFDPRCPIGFTRNMAAASSPSQQCPFTFHTYDQFDRIQQIVNPLGGVLNYDRVDPNGNPELVTLNGPTGDKNGGRALLSKATYQYDELNRLVEQQQHVLRVVDSRQRQLKEDLEAAVSTQWIYNRDGQVERIIGPGKGETSFTYDALHRQDLVTDAEGNQAKHQYDKAGNLEFLRETDIEWTKGGDLDPPTPGKQLYVTQWKYDALHRPVSRIDSGGHTRRLFHDSLGSVRGQIDEEGRSMVMVYNNLGRLMEVTQLGQKTTYEYYPAGTTKVVRTPVSERYWEYDALGRVVLAREGKAETKIEPDAAGNPHVLTDANGTVITTEFNGLNLPIAVEVVYGTVPESETLPAFTHLGTEKGETPKETFRYDGLGRLVHADNGTAAVDRLYDGLSRLLLEAQSFRPADRRLYDTHGVLTAYDTDLERYETQYPIIAGRSRVIANLDKLGRVSRLQLDGRDLGDYRYAGKDRIAWRRAGNFVETFRQYDDERKNWRVTVSQVGDRLARWTAAFDVHTPTRVAEEYRTEAGKRFRIIENVLDRQRRPTVTRTYGFTRLDNPPTTGLFERARTFLTGVQAGSPEQVDIMLTETLRQYDQIGRVSRMAEVSFDESNEAFGQIRLDRFGYNDLGRIGSTATRLSQGVKQGPGALAQLVSAALANVKALTFGVRSAVTNDPLLFVTDPPSAVARHAPRGLRAAVAGTEASQPAFAQSQVFNTTVDRAFNDADSILETPGFPPETQAFRYDANGNLVQDGRYLYAYDHQNRLVRIQDTVDRRQVGSGGQQFFDVQFLYDPLGRKVFQHYGPDVTDDGLTDLRFLYDGQRLIAELALGPEGQNPTLLARYFYGAGGQDLLRMDRRANEQLGRTLATHYLHDGFQEGTIFASGTVGVARAKQPAFVDVGVVRDDRVIEKSTTRLPYSAQATRREPMSGLACQEATGTCLFDFRSAPSTQRRLEQQEFRERLLAQTTGLQREVLTVLAVEVAPVVASEMLAWTTFFGSEAGAASLVSGVFGVGVDYGMTKLMGHDYSIEQGIAAFGLSALSAGFGASMTSTFGATGKVAAALGIGMDVAAGTATDVLLYGQNFQDALVTNLVFNTASAAIGMSVGRVRTREPAGISPSMKFSRAPPVTDNVARLKKVRADRANLRTSGAVDDLAGNVPGLDRTGYAELWRVTDRWIDLKGTADRPVFLQMENPIAPGMSCGPTSCAMALHTLGGKFRTITPLELIRKMGTREFGGTDVEAKARLFKELGIESYRKEKISLDDLWEMTKEGKPAILSVGFPWERVGHTFVVDRVIRKDKKIVGIRVRDPATGGLVVSPEDMEFYLGFQRNEAYGFK